MAKKKTPGPPPTDTAAETTTPAPRRRAATPKVSKTETATPSGSQTNPTGSQTNMGDSTPTLMSSPAAVPAVQPTYDQIAEAAYLRYLNRGGGDGRDFEDWLEAEQELKTR